MADAADFIVLFGLVLQASREGQRAKYGSSSGMQLLARGHARTHCYLKRMFSISRHLTRKEARQGKSDGSDQPYVIGHAGRYLFQIYMCCTYMPGI